MPECQGTPYILSTTSTRFTGTWLGYGCREVTSHRAPESSQRLRLPPNVPAINIHIFSLAHQLRLLLTLTFVPLPYLFSLCHDVDQLGGVYLRNV